LYALAVVYVSREALAAGILTCGTRPISAAGPLQLAVDWAIVNTWEAARKLGDSGSLVRPNVAARDVRPPDRI
jgi:hypothetical protein